MNQKDLLGAMKLLVRSQKNAPTAYSFGDKSYSANELNEVVRSELKALAPDYRTYKINQNTIFALMEETIEDVLPQKVMEQYGQFAEVKQFAQGDKPYFTQRITNAAKQRAKQFIGKVGLAGLYEVFILDGQDYEVATNAMGGAAQIQFEQFLDGRIDFADVLDIVLEGLDESIYYEIQKQLSIYANYLPTANKVTATVFNEQQFDRLIQTASAYGIPTIYCTYEFAATMVPTDSRMSNEMKNNLWNNGYFGTYKGTRVAILKQSYTDETNATKVIDPSQCYIIPTGANKPVKIALEGSTIVDEYTNYDRSREIQIYKKIGVGVVASNDICIYTNSSLTRANK